MVCLGHGGGIRGQLLTPIKVDLVILMEKLSMINLFNCMVFVPCFAIVKRIF